MQFIKRLFGVRSSGSSQSHVFGNPTDAFSDLRLVMAVTHAVLEKFTDSPPEMVAALALAETDKNRQNLVERPEGVYLSKECSDRLRSYEVWLDDRGAAFITRKRLESKPDEPKEDAQRFLNERIPAARKVGKVNSFHYTLGLCMSFGVNADRLLMQSEGRVAVYLTGPTVDCYGCGKTFAKGNSAMRTTRKLVTKKGADEFHVKYFCSQECRNSEVARLNSLSMCSWCGTSVSSSIPGGVGEPYCSKSCYSAAGNIFADLGDREMQDYL
jgi:hypothetical protein